MSGIGSVRLCVFAIAIAWMGASPAAEPPAPASPPPAATTAADPKIPIEELELLLRPMSKEEVAVEAAAWQGLLRDKIKAVSDLRIQARHAEGDEKAALLEKVNPLRDEQVALVDRLNAVVGEWKRKGGDAKDIEAYIAAISGIPLDVQDAGAAWTTLVGWLKSPEGGLRWGKNIIFFILILLAFWILALILSGIARTALAKSKLKVSDLLKDFFVNVVRKLTIFIGFIMALSVIEIDIGPFIAALGVAGFVIGFALQGTLSNFAAGLMILLYRPYDIGEWITAAGVTGKVESMTLVSTILATPDNQTVVIPNGSIWGGVITNITGKKTRRVDLVFGISYADDIAKAERVLREIVENHPLILKDPEPVIKVHALSDSSVDFVCRPWTNTPDYWTVYWDLTRAVKERFTAEGISIPFPHQEVYVHQT
ncbi:MAG: mechanosensitive ion channel family protein [Planctomycetes bacterium]|nr:mechanosensitive ion channel family protein [Planctomycetota bacterium]